MQLICPDSACPNHHPHCGQQWFDYHGSYVSCRQQIQRYRCRRCRRTFSHRTLSIDYWTHSHIDYQSLITLFASGLSVRALARYLRTSVKTIQNRFARLARTIIPTLSVLQDAMTLKEDLVADGLENFCVSQDFPNNIHILVGKESQYTYGFNYALMRRKGRKTAEQQKRCEQLYGAVDFTVHTIYRTFGELATQVRRVARGKESFTLYTDKKEQYPLALVSNPDIRTMMGERRFRHVTISSQAPRTTTNHLFSVNYMDREIRKDLAEYHRETVCFGRNVCNALERLCVYVFYHNFIKVYRIAVAGEDRTHAEAAGLSREDVVWIRDDVKTRRRFIADGEIERGGFFDQLWRRQIPTPLAKRSDHLPIYAIA